MTGSLHQSWQRTHRLPGGCMSQALDGVTLNSLVSCPLREKRSSHSSSVRGDYSAVGVLRPICLAALPCSVVDCLAGRAANWSPASRDDGTRGMADTRIVCIQVQRSYRWQRHPQSVALQLQTVVSPSPVLSLGSDGAASDSIGSSVSLRYMRAGTNRRPERTRLALPVYFHATRRAAQVQRWAFVTA